MQGGEASGSQGARGRTTRNPSGRSRPATNPQAWEATSDDEGGKDDEIDLPPAHAPVIRGLVLHRAEARRAGNEPVTDFTASGGSALLQDIHFQNPALRIRDARIDGNRFWTLQHVDFYNSVILPKKHQPILHQCYINWEGYEAIGDPEMTHALRACERKKMKNIMTFQYDWNDEVIAQFYSTLWIKLTDEESPYNFPYLNFYIEGSWYKVSYRRFAHILGFTDNDISGDKIKIHDFRQPTKDEARDLHLSESGKYWESTNMHKYYRYINSLSRMTLIPKGGNQMNILGESKVLLSFMKPSSSESINVFDMIWQEIIHDACFPLKGCLHAPFIMKMIEVVTQFRYDKGTRHQSYTPFWIDPNNPAERLRKAPSSSRAHTSAGPSAGPAAAAGASRPSPGHGSPTSHGRGRGRGMGARLAHGIAAFFSMCRNISADVHELARRQRETDDNLRRQACTMGMPFAPRSPDVPLHLPPPEINEWHQQAYGVPFMSADDEEEEEAYFNDREQFAPPPYHGDPGQSSSHPLPQDPSRSAPLPDQSGEEHFASHLAHHFFAPHQPPPNW
jgi:hypothetical protein